MNHMVPSEHPQPRADRHWDLSSEEDRETSSEISHSMTPQKLENYWAGGICPKIKALPP